MTPEEFRRKLEAISIVDGVLYSRRRRLRAAEAQYGEAANQLQGTVALTNAFQCFFIETVESMKSASISPGSSYFGIFLQRLIHSFQSLCAADKLGTCGYPLHAYAMLRNTFDNNQLTTACFQKVATFDDVIGASAVRQLDKRESKKLRKDTEFAVRRWASGEDSGLESAVVDQLRVWDDLFDTEIHGARLSMALALAADPEESGGMPVLPTYGEKAHAMFMNRHCEIGWTTHRLVPMVQAPGCPFAPEWREKWSILDECC